MARRYLVILATSILIEQIFSISSNIITISRNRLEPEAFKQIISLKSWKLKDLKELENNFRNSK